MDYEISQFQRIKEEDKIMQPRLIDDTIVFEKEKGSVYLYSLVNKKAAKIRKENYRKDLLKQLGFFNSIAIANKSPQPGPLFLLLTRNCPLKCIYCYANGGLKKETMSVNIAEEAVDAYLRLNPASPNVRFGGGGEPTLEEELIRYIITKFEGSIIWTMITSGVMKENFLRWLIEKKVNITFSVDGPPVVQNFHRPLKGGGDSSGIVEKNVKIYRELRGKLHIRATLSKISIQNLNDVLCYWKNIGVTAVSAEPLYPMGRGDNSPFVPEPEETLNALITILEWGRKNRIPIRTSALFYSLPTSNLDLIPCGPLSGNALVVNHQGYLLACGEALDPEHPFWQIWMIGQLKNGKFELDHSRLEELSQMTSVEKIELCKKCFAKYVCRGGCIMRRLFQTGSLAKPDPYHCFVAKNLLINIIIRTVEGKYRFSPNYTV